CPHQSTPSRPATARCLAVKFDFLSQLGFPTINDCLMFRLVPKGKLGDTEPMLAEKRCLHSLRIILSLLFLTFLR
ncbi:MAG: hypothetical protein RMK89_13580, partial [Armatimonadota bacterium]|nr:hypothetical protein [Armatimonadota bacterium]MDW8144479.1 hypothetical protein [Armatimonadota bacterium]